MDKQPHPSDKHAAEAIHRLCMTVVFLLLVIAGLVYVLLFGAPKLHVEAPLRADNAPAPLPFKSSDLKKSWIAPDTGHIPRDNEGDLIRYGRELIANTSFYLGPNGSVAHVSNGMNCQNCHLNAGTKPYGNNYSAVASTYPKFRERSGTIENIYKRVNDCFQRSLNGKGLDTTSREMQAIKAYITWLGTDVPKGQKPEGSGIRDLTFLDRPADPEKGKMLFASKCVSCHGENGKGKMNPDNRSYQYPPLWGENSYNTGAGLYRLSRFAGYIAYNMPLGSSKENPQLSEEEAWDIAAFVNSQERPVGDVKKDWPKLSGKPYDNPFGPYADEFTEKQHKFGPFAPIVAAAKKNKKTKS